MGLIVECTICHVAKPADEQHFPVEVWGLRRQCRPCRAAQKREALLNYETPERRASRLAKNREYARHNAKQIAETQKVWRSNNKDLLAHYFKAYYQRHKEHKKAQAVRWSKANRRRKNEYNRRWAAENAEAALAQYRASKRKRRSNPKVRLFESISAQMRTSLLKAKDGRRWERLVGFTRVELVEHLERQFTDGINWDNYGDWHIDHIVPASSFQYALPRDTAFKACWALANLRPIWAQHNISKGAKRLHLL